MFLLLTVTAHRTDPTDHAALSTHFKNPHKNKTQNPHKPTQNPPTSSPKPTVQHECIPQAVLGMDIICQAKSGMGKTAVFVLGRCMCVLCMYVCVCIYVCMYLCVCLHMS
jgi:hypothetical protein